MIPDAESTQRYQELYLVDKEEEITTFDSTSFLYKMCDRLKRTPIYLCALLKICECLESGCECSMPHYHTISNVTMEDLSNCMFICTFETSDNITYLQKPFVRFFSMDDNDNETNIIDVIYHTKKEDRHKDNYVKFYDDDATVIFRLSRYVVGKEYVEFQFNYMMFDIL